MSNFTRYNPSELFSTGQSGGVCAVKYAYAFATQNTTVTLVAAVTAKKIRVVSVAQLAADTTSGILQNGRFLSSTGSVQLSPYMLGRGYIAADQTFIDWQPWQFNPAGWFETAAGDILQLQALAAASGGIGALVGYIEV